MADATFTREALEAYGKRPQTQVPDKKMVADFMKGSTPARQASGADIANAGALAPEGAPSRIQDIAAGGTPAAARASATADDDFVVDETGELGDQSATDEGTSDDLTAESSTATDDPGADADAESDLTAAPAKEEQDEDEPAKGSARERIVELNDKLEGAMVIGKAFQEQLKVQMEENARLRAERSPNTSASAPGAAPPVVVSDDPGPMPQMKDADIQFDDDKYQARMQEWSRKSARHEARQLFREMTGASAANALTQEVNAKAEAYAAEHPEFTEYVTNNPVLKANQLAPDAAVLVAKSPLMADILMEFGKDPAYAIRVAKMSPADQLAEVGEVRARVKARKAAGKNTSTTAPTKQTTQQTRTGAQPGARKSVSQAPPPPRATPAGGRSKTFDPLDPNASMEDLVNDHRRGKQAARAENRRLRGLS